MLTPDLQAPVYQYGVLFPGFSGGDHINKQGFIHPGVNMSCGRLAKLPEPSILEQRHRLGDAVRAHGTVVRHASGQRMGESRVETEMVRRGSALLGTYF